MNVADLILKQLASYGVRLIFGVIGDAIFPLGDALARQDRIRFIPAAIETAAAFMATYSARVTGSLGVCIATSGPGAANLVNGVAEAYRDRLPVLCLTGQVPGAKIGTHVKQYFNQQTLFTAITGASELCISPDAALPVLNLLIAKALSERVPVHLAIPQDILAAEINGNIAVPLPIPPHSEGKGFFSGDLEKALTWMNEAQRPVFIIGRESRPYTTPLRSLAAGYGAGIVIGLDNKGGLPDTDPLVIGGVGPANLPESWSEIDLIISFGEAVYERPYLPEGARYIRLCDETSVLYDDGALLLNGDLETLINRLAEKSIVPGVREAWRARIETTRRNNQIQLRERSDSRDPVRFFRVLASLIRPDALITLDVGEFMHWFNWSFPAQTQTVLVSSNWRSMGCALAAAIAAKLHHTERQVVAIIGDGGFLMSLGELNTVIRLGLPLTVLVLRNGVYGLEMQKMAQMGFKPCGTELQLPNIPQLASACGWNSYQLNDLNGCESILETAFQNPASLVDVNIDSQKLPYLK